MMNVIISFIVAAALAALFVACVAAIAEDRPECLVAALQAGDDGDAIGWYVSTHEGIEFFCFVETME